MKITNPMEFIGRFKNLLYDLTIGLVKNYQEKTIQLAKLEAASFYVKAIQLIRRQCVALCGIFFCLAVAAVGLVVLPAVIILVLPVTTGLKVALLALLSVIEIVIPLVLLSHCLSEDKWLEFTKSKELLEELTNNR